MNELFILVFFRHIWVGIAGIQLTEICYLGSLLASVVNYKKLAVLYI